MADDRAGLAWLLHEWVAATVNHLKIEHIWEPTPFPIELRSWRLMLRGRARFKEELQMRLLWIALFALATPAVAAEIGPCDTLDRVSFLVGQTKSYSSGKVTTAHVDTDGEPVCCSSHLLVIIPGPETGSQCFAVSDKAGGKDSSARGFNSVGFDKIKALYDAQRGLLLTVPYTLYDDGRAGRPGQTKVRIDLRGEGSVKIER